MNVTAAHAVHEISQIAGPRRSALELARQNEFSEERAGKVALVVTELATNLAKHAKDGEILFRPIRDENGAARARGIEILAVDRGPGMPDVPGARRDGYSTTGTLGHGLGSIERQSFRNGKHDTNKPLRDKKTTLRRVSRTCNVDSH